LPPRPPSSTRFPYTPLFRSVDGEGRVVHRYRKVHLPGHAEHEPWRAFQHLEKRYFEPGPEGFTVTRAFGGIVGLLICNDRRWPRSEEHTSELQSRENLVCRL